MVKCHSVRFLLQESLRVRIPGQEESTFLIIAEPSDRVSEIAVEDMILRSLLCAIGSVHIRDGEFIQSGCEHVLGGRTGQRIMIGCDNKGRRESTDKRHRTDEPELLFIPPAGLQKCFQGAER